MRTRLWTVLALVVAVSLAWPGGAIAASVDANSPQRLYSRQKVTGTLPGSPAGSFHYYAIPYPGDGSVVTIKMVFTPGDDIMRQVAGFNVYGLNGAGLGSGELSGEGETKAAARVFRFADGTPATWLIQVYNYSPGHAADYTLVFDGLPLSAPAPVSSASAADGAVVGVGGPVEVSGALAGNGGGAYVETRVRLQAGVETSVTLGVAGGPPPVRRAVGLNVYGPYGLAAAASAESDPYVMQVTFVPEQAGEYLLQIYNYDPTYTLFYRLIR